MTMRTKEEILADFNWGMVGGRYEQQPHPLRDVLEVLCDLRDLGRDYLHHVRNVDNAAHIHRQADEAIAAKERERLATILEVRAGYDPEGRVRGEIVRWLREGGKA